MKWAYFVILVFVSSNLFGQQKLADFQKGAIRLKVGLPYLNHLILKPNEAVNSSKVGFIGESLGFEYSYADKRFVEINFSFIGVADNPLPFPFDKEGAFTRQYSSYLSITHNHQLNRMTYGYGLNYSTNTWAEGYRSFEDASLDTRNQITNQAYGLTLNSYYRIGKAFNIGLIYRPSYLSNIPVLKNRYEHLLSLEFLWRIRLNRK